MIHNTKIMIFTGIIIFLLFSCGHPKEKWNGVIKNINGIPHIINPRTPIYSSNIFELEEDLSIGDKEGREEFVFSRIRIEVDEHENIYVLEEKANEIRVYDKRGKHIRNIGKFGQGPGEFQRPRVYFQHTINNEIAVYDVSTKRIIFFTEMGEFIDQISMARILILKKMIMHPTGNYILINSTYPPADELTIFNNQLENSQIIFRKQIESMVGNDLPVRIPKIHFSLKDNNVIWGYSNRYELNISDLNNILKYKIKKKYKPIKLSKYDKEKLQETYKTTGVNLIFQKYNPAFGDITVDEDGRIFVMTYERSKNFSNYYDVFSSEGKYIAKIPLGYRPYIWKNNKMYTIVSDDDDYLYIKRFKVRWNLNNKDN